MLIFLVIELLKSFGELLLRRNFDGFVAPVCIITDHWCQHPDSSLENLVWGRFSDKKLQNMKKHRKLFARDQTFQPKLNKLALCVFGFFF